LIAFLGGKYLQRPCDSRPPRHLGTRRSDSFSANETMALMSSRKKIIVETGGPLVNRLSSAGVGVSQCLQLAWQRVATA
jgi:hypothetical protein